MFRRFVFSVGFLPNENLEKSTLTHEIELYGRDRRARLSPR